MFLFAAALCSQGVVTSPLPAVPSLVASPAMSQDPSLIISNGKYLYRIVVCLQYTFMCLDSRPCTLISFPCFMQLLLLSTIATHIIENVDIDVIVIICRACVYTLAIEEIFLRKRNPNFGIEILVICYSVIVYGTIILV